MSRPHRAEGAQSSIFDRTGPIDLFALRGQADEPSAFPAIEKAGQVPPLNNRWSYPLNSVGRASF
ncbi:MAG: hypothetical protein QOE96_2321 [Blastocatellia bacterium]|nr:hypothetical protein [Blastocatellia bacterium]